MSDNPKHSWLRFRLLTAVLMMFAAGVLLAQNAKVFTTTLGGYGWPFIFNEPPWDYRRGLFPVAGAPGPPGGTDFISWKFHTVALLVDCSIGIAVVLLVAFISESILRRRAVVKSAQTEYRETKPCS